MKTLIVLPTYNEKDNLESLTQKILELDFQINILIVDDSSPDGTGKLADELVKRDNRILVLHREKKEGLGKAYLEGFKYAIAHTDADYIMEMDSDFSHDPSYLPNFIQKIEQCDVVVGSRFYQGRLSIVNWPIMRLICSYGASIYVRVFTWLHISDPTSGFKCFRRDVVENILANHVISNGYAFQIEINYICKKLGFHIHEIPIVFYDRERGASKMSTLRTIFEAISIIWILKFKRFRRVTK